MEALPEVAGAPRQFDVVTLRAVDNMEQALAEARRRVKPGGWLVALTTELPNYRQRAIKLPGDGVRLGEPATSRVADG